jgi:hypothetical protein
MVNSGQIDRVAADVVHQSSWTRHYYLHISAKLRYLITVRNTAIDGNGANTRTTGEGLDYIINLFGQLTGRRQN